MLKRVAGLATLLLFTTLIITGVTTACAPLMVEMVNKEAEGSSTTNVEQTARESDAEVVAEEQGQESENAALTVEERVAGAGAVDSEALLETVQSAAEEGAIELTEEELDTAAVGEELVEIVKRGADEGRLDLTEGELATDEELVKNAEGITE